MEQNGREHVSIGRAQPAGPQLGDEEVHAGLVLPGPAGFEWARRGRVDKGDAQRRCGAGERVHPCRHRRPQPWFKTDDPRDSGIGHGPQPGQLTLDNGVEDRLGVLEVAVDDGAVHAGFGGHGVHGERAHASGRDEVGRDIKQLRAPFRGADPGGRQRASTGPISPAMFEK